MKSALYIRIAIIVQLCVITTTNFTKANVDVNVQNLTCEYTTNPLGIDKLPRLGWQVTSKYKEKYQSAYQILISTSQQNIEQNIGDVFDSKKIISTRQSGVYLEGIDLESATRYFWKVRIWDEKDLVSPYSDPAYFETGLLDPDDWKAAWISSPTVIDWNRYYLQLDEHIRKKQRISYTPETQLFKSFNISDSIMNARVFISGLGFYTLQVNDYEVAPTGLNPAFTDYTKRVLYNTYDITEALHIGQNEISIGLGNGFYNEEAIVDWGYDKASWKGHPKLMCQIYINLQNGLDTLIVSDTSWFVKPSHIRRNSVFAGELHDYSLDFPNHDHTNMRTKAIYAPAPTGRMVSQIMPLEEIGSSFPPQKVERLPSGSFIIDAGINLSGKLSITFEQHKSDTIEIIYGELLNKDGTVDQSNISRKTLENIQTDVIILSGTGDKVKWSPKYEYHGFRYAEIKGYSGDITKTDVNVHFIHTRLEKTGTFSCSSTLINKLQEATIRSYLSNYHGYPTDCPQREKNGWTADAHLAARVGLYNFNMQTSFEKWMNDFDDARLADGRLPGIVPTSGWGYQIYYNITDPIGPAWDAAYILIPWYCYVYTGNKKILSDHYIGMKKHLSYLSSRSEDHIVKYGLADWAYYNTPTNWEVTSTIYYGLMAQTLSKIANVLDKKGEAKHYQDLYECIKSAFNTRFFDKDAISYASGSQTARAGAIYCGFADSTSCKIIMDNLEKEIIENNYSLDCGILGAEFLLKTLSSYGKQETVYKIITNKEMPGWGYWIEQGATTLWESWDKNDSKNHVMFGHISEWFYKHLAGIQPIENHPGFKHFLIAPIFPNDLEWVSGNTNSPYGEIKCEWKRIGNNIELSLSIPYNSTAKIVLPDEFQIINHTINLKTMKANVDKNVISNLGSGRYTITCLLSE